MRVPVEEPVNPKGSNVLKMEGKEPTNGTPPLEIEDAVTIRRAKVEEMQRRRAEAGARHKLREGIKEAEAKGKLEEIKRKNVDDYDWLQKDARHKELAFEPDTKSFKVNEARAALEAERQGLLKPPVKRAVDEAGGSRGGDYIDGDGKYWDVEDASAKADLIVKTAASGERVLVDARKLSAAEATALESEVKVKLPKGAAEVKFARK